MRALVIEQSAISVLETWTPGCRARAVSPRCPSTKARGSSSALLRLAPITTLGYRCIREERDTRAWLLIGQMNITGASDWLELVKSEQRYRCRPPQAQILRAGEAWSHSHHTRLVSKTKLRHYLKNCDYNVHFGRCIVTIKVLILFF